MSATLIHCSHRLSAVYMEIVCDVERVVWRWLVVRICNADVFQHRLHVWVRETSENSSCITNEVRRSLRKGKQQRDGIQSFFMVRISSSRWDIRNCCKHAIAIFISECCIGLLIVSDLGVRPVGYEAGDRFVKVPEMIPELIVPDLTGFKVVL